MACLNLCEQARILSQRYCDCVWLSSSDCVRLNPLKQSNCCYICFAVLRRIYAPCPACHAFSSQIVHVIHGSEFCVLLPFCGQLLEVSTRVISKCQERTRPHPYLIVSQATSQRSTNRCSRMCADFDNMDIFYMPVREFNAASDEVRYLTHPYSTHKGPCVISYIQVCHSFLRAT